MLSRISFWFYDFRDSLWYRPALMTIGAAVLAFVMLWIDERIVQQADLHTWWLFEGGAEGARGVLSAIAGTMITVVTMAFSITMVALQLGSSQYSPRILRNFTGDPGNQLVLGLFIATFVYCLLVLRSVRSELDDRGAFVPGLSITVAILLALICMGSLIYFLHHATRTIQATVILDNTAWETFRLIDMHFDVEGERMSDRTRALLSRLPTVTRVNALTPGYLRGVDDPRLVDIARQHDLLLTVHSRIGDRLFTGSPMVSVQRFTMREPDPERDGEESDGLLDKLESQLQAALQPDDGENEDEDGDEGIHDSADSEEEDALAQLEGDLRWQFTLGMERTLNEDVLYGVQQLTDIGLRAMSRAINDPTTAMLCLDQLGEALIRVQETNDRPTVAVDDEGTPRVVYPPISFERFLDMSIRQLRHHSARDPFVCQHIVEVLGAVHEAITNEDARAELAAEARLTVEAVRRSNSLPEDLQQVRTAASWAFTGE